MPKEPGQKTATLGHSTFLSGLSGETERSEIQITPSQVTSQADSSLCSVSFDEARRANSISRAYASHRDE
jgi:hypothetical protein